ncbi:hypothetical protein NKI80_25255 [Mesorhizobium sp. M0387]|uniref:hypothetical protein n=1 Tax=Mesorhizobium sp. M0387 TaxID=2956940 RepID=UPI00333CD217
MPDRTLDVRVIRDPYELLDWVVEQAIQSEPQVPMASAFIDVLHKVIARVNEYGFLPEEGEPWAMMGELVDMLSDPSETTYANEGLVSLMNDILAHVMFLEWQVELHELVEKFADVARIGTCLFTEDVGAKVRFKSTPDLARTRGVSINVLVARNLQIGNPRRPDDPRTPNLTRVLRQG